MIYSFRKGHPRITNQILLALMSLSGCITAYILASPRQVLLESLTLGTGYVGLLLILLTLVIGPLKLLKVRKNPVNLNFRRDTGIWAGINSLAHVVFISALQLSWGDSLLSFFLNKEDALKFDLFAISNDLGFIAGLIILFLMVLSNNFFLKRLKGKNWKNFQRLNYLLLFLALAHTFGEQINLNRNPVLIYSVIGLACLATTLQSVGVAIYRSRELQRRPANNSVQASIFQR